MPGGDTASEAERVIAEHLDLVRLNERRRVAGLLRARGERLEDVAGSVRRAESDIADEIAGQAVTWHRAARLALAE